MLAQLTELTKNFLAEQNSCTSLVILLDVALCCAKSFCWRAEEGVLHKFEEVVHHVFYSKLSQHMMTNNDAEFAKRAAHHSFSTAFCAKLWQYIVWSSLGLRAYQHLMVLFYLFFFFCVNLIFGAAYVYHLLSLLYLSFILSDLAGGRLKPEKK